MFNIFGDKRKKTVKQAATITEPIEGQAYIIGDIHGCFDEMEALLGYIKADVIARPQQRTQLIFLGDLIDRGPKSCQVVDFLRNFNPDWAEVHFLMGNHEEVYLSVMGGSLSSLASWFQFGGRECARSYSVENLGRIYADPEGLLREIRRKVPQSHIDFVSSFRDYLVVGPYLCVHAGIRPRIKLENQKPKDFRWIREGFVNYTKPHDYIVVHGHTIVPEPVIHSNRIAIDTGAYTGGPLTALRIDKVGQAFLQSPMRVAG